MQKLWEKIMNNKLTTIMTAKILLCVIALITFSAGCGTIVMRSVEPGEALYPATQGDIAMIHASLRSGGSIITGPSYLAAALTVIDIPISLATDTILFPIDLARRQDIRKKKADRQRESFEINQIASEIRKFPSIIFDKDWYRSDDVLIKRAFEASLKDPETNFTVEMLERLMTESPGYNILILRHPKCPTHLLVEHFTKAYNESISHSEYRPLASIVSNPNTPIELVEKVAKSQNIPVGAVYPAQEALKHRQRELQNGSPSGSVGIEGN